MNVIYGLPKYDSGQVTCSTYDMDANEACLFQYIYWAGDWLIGPLERESSPWPGVNSIIVIAPQVEHLNEHIPLY